MSNTYWADNKASVWITRPTIADIRTLLDQFEANGWKPEQHIELKQIANALGSFGLNVVNPEAVA